MPGRPVPCDLADPGWGILVSHGTFVASLTRWYGLVIWNSMGMS